MTLSFLQRLHMFSSCLGPNNTRLVIFFPSWCNGNSLWHYILLHVGDAACLPWAIHKDNIRTDIMVWNFYPSVITSKSMTCRFSTSVINRPLLYSSWANWATVSVWGSLSLMPYRISFMDTKHFDTSSDAWRRGKKSLIQIHVRERKWSWQWGVKKWQGQAVPCSDFTEGCYSWACGHQGKTHTHTCILTPLPCLSSYPVWPRQPDFPSKTWQCQQDSCEIYQTAAWWTHAWLGTWETQHTHELHQGAICDKLDALRAVQWYSCEQDVPSLHTHTHTHSTTTTTFTTTNNK